MTKLILCSFASSNILNPVDRFRNQGRSMGVYNRIDIYNEKLLLPEFYGRFADKLTTNVRGFGYWCWKPQVILQTLETLDNGDIIHYADIGVHLLSGSVYCLKLYVDICKDSKSGMLVFDMGHTEKAWTKRDLYKYFGLLGQENQLNETNQRWAGSMFIQKSPKTIELVEKWAQVFHEDWHLVDDSPSFLPNDADFIEHRHDQSAFSLLTKMYKVPALPYNEIAQPFVRPIYHAHDRFDN